MNILLESSKSIELYKYFFTDSKTINYKHYYLWIIDIEDEENVSKVLSFLEEMFIDVVFFKHENKYFMFYFSEIDFEVESIISSIIDDFSIKLNIYASSKMDFKNKDNFFVLYNLYKKYLKTKSNFYTTNVDLVSEIILNNIDDLDYIKPIILNNLLDDPQMEGLIQAMFNSNLNVTKTASLIYMHRNTVIKKLEYIKNITGLNIQKFSDANIMYWLLRKK